MIICRFENYIVDVTVGDKHYELALWDTGGIYWLLLANYVFDSLSIGQEDFDNVRPLSYPNTVNSVILCLIYIHSFQFQDVVLLVFSLVNRDSLENIIDRVFKT